MNFVIVVLSATLFILHCVHCVQCTEWLSSRCEGGGYSVIYFLGFMSNWQNMKIIVEKIILTQIIANFFFFFNMTLASLGRDCLFCCSSEIFIISSLYCKQIFDFKYILAKVHILFCSYDIEVQPPLLVQKS